MKVSDVFHDAPRVPRRGALVPLARFKIKYVTRILPHAAANVKYCFCFAVPFAPPAGRGKQKIHKKGQKRARNASAAKFFAISLTNRAAFDKIPLAVND